jgi:hypothetical protein
LHDGGHQPDVAAPAASPRRAWRRAVATSSLLGSVPAALVSRGSGRSWCANREIRGFVLWRKTSYGSCSERCSERGDAFAANLKSVVHTCRKQGRPVLPYLTAAIQASLRGAPAPSLIVNR